MVISLGGLIGRARDGEKVHLVPDGSLLMDQRRGLIQTDPKYSSGNPSALRLQEVQPYQRAIILKNCDL